MGVGLRLFLLTISTMKKSNECILNVDDSPANLIELQEKNEAMQHHITIMYALATHEQHDSLMVEAAEYLMEKCRVAYQKNEPIFG